MHSKDMPTLSLTVVLEAVVKTSRLEQGELVSRSQ